MLIDDHITEDMLAQMVAEKGREWVVSNFTRCVECSVVIPATMEVCPICTIEDKMGKPERLSCGEACLEYGWGDHEPGVDCNKMHFIFPKTKLIYDREVGGQFWTLAINEDILGTYEQIAHFLYQYAIGEKMIREEG